MRQPWSGLGRGFLGNGRNELRGRPLGLSGRSLDPCDLLFRPLPELPETDDGYAVRYALAGMRNVGEKAMEAIVADIARQNDVRELIKLKAIYELLESVSDKCELVAVQIEGIVLENS